MRGWATPSMSERIVLTSASFHKLEEGGFEQDPVTFTAELLMSGSHRCAGAGPRHLGWVAYRGFVHVRVSKASLYLEIFTLQKIFINGSHRCAGAWPRLL